jgi:hypothetical protein
VFATMQREQKRIIRIRLVQIRVRFDKEEKAEHLLA